MPLTETANLLSWLEADAGISVADGAAVELWSDQSGAGHDASRTSNAGTPDSTLNVPTYALNQRLGLPVVRFRNVNAGLDFSGISNVRASYTFYAVVRYDAGQGNTSYLISTTSGGGGLIFQGDTPLEAGSPSVDFALSGNPDVEGPGAISGWQLLTVIADATAHTVSFYRNKVLLATKAYTSDGSTDTDWILAGTFGLGFLFDAGEIILYHTAHNATQRGSVWDYLWSKWLMPIPTISCNSLPHSSFDKATLRDDVRGDIALDGTPVLTDAQIDRWGQEAQDRIALESRWYRVASSFTTTAGVAEYHLPCTSIAVREVWVNDVRLPALSADDFWQKGRSAVGSAASGYYIQAETLLGLVPTPISAETITVYVEALPPAPALATDTYSIPNGLDQAITCYCKLRASQRDSYGEGGQRIASLDAEWERWLQSARAYVAAYAEREIQGLAESGLAALRSAIYGDLDYQGRPPIADRDLRRWGKEAQDRIALESRWYRISVQVPVLSGIAEYTAPSGALAVREAWLDGRRLNEIAADDLWLNGRTAVGGTVSAFYVQGETLVGLAPTPMSSAQLTLYVEALPGLPDDLTDFKTPAGLEAAIVCFTKLRACQKDPDRAGQIPALAAEWEHWLQSSRAHVAAFAERELLGLGTTGLGGLRAALYGDLDYLREVPIADRDLRRWATEASNRIAFESRWYRIATTITLTSGVAEYAIPSGAIAVREAWLSGRRLNDVSADDLWWPGRNLVGGGPSLSYYIQGESVIGLIPTPGSSGILTLYTEALPPVPDDRSNFPTPAGFEDALLCYVKLKASQKDSQGPGAGRVPGFQLEWERWLLKAREYVDAYAEEEILGVGSDGLSPRRHGPQFNEWGQITPG